MFLFKGICKISMEGMFHGHPQPDIVEGDSIVGNFVNEPSVLGLDPLIDMWALEVSEEQQAMLIGVLHGYVGEVNAHK